MFNGPNNNANKGRRNALANRACNAANRISNSNPTGAIESLQSALAKLDGDAQVPDWMDNSPEKTDVAANLALLIYLLGF